MREYIADKLNDSREYRNISLKHCFGNPDLDYRVTRNVFAQKKFGFAEENDSLNYLVVAHAAKIGSENLISMNKAAKQQNIPIMHVLYKGRNSHFFRWDKAIFKPSRMAYSEEDKKAMVNTNKMERYLSLFTGNKVVYFSQYHLLLQVIKFKDVVSDYSESNKVPEKLREELKEYENLQAKIAEVVMETSRFTLKRATKYSIVDYRMPAKLVDLDLDRICSLLSQEEKALKDDHELAAELGERIVMMWDGMESKVNKAIASKMIGTKSQ